jgi:hypothetical protein
MGPTVSLNPLIGKSNPWSSGHIPNNACSSSWFFSGFQENFRIAGYLKLGHDRFLSHRFQFIWFTQS